MKDNIKNKSVRDIEKEIVELEKHKAFSESNLQTLLTKGNWNLLSAHANVVNVAEKQINKLKKEIFIRSNSYKKARAKGFKYSMEKSFQFREEKIWKYCNLDTGDEEAIAEIARSISRTVINTAIFRAYFSKIEGSWYLTFIDIRSPCVA